MSKIDVPVRVRVLGVLAGNSPNFREMSNCSKYGPETLSQSGTLLPEWAGVTIQRSGAPWAKGAVVRLPTHTGTVPTDAIMCRYMLDIFWSALSSIFYLSVYSRHSLEASTQIFSLWCQQKHTQKTHVPLFFALFNFFLIHLLNRIWAVYTKKSGKQHSPKFSAALCINLKYSSSISIIHNMYSSICACVCVA